ncbi:MAG TPA: bifunctional riboflavin kinase/FAD synthetase [Candidatus Acidoferrum sp.]|nr:bifunctional riboflavin kinase/FAD synthetase [Candidatus Acidoferrum sp.]
MSGDPLKLTILGSGTSMGVPSLGCQCRVCTSSDPHDNRLRPSLLLSRCGQNVVIDTTPDFRQQALRTGIQRLDAVLFTHAHADHIFGFDDIRPFNMRQRTTLPVFASKETFQILRGAFAYVFDGKPKLSSVPHVEVNFIDGPIHLLGTTITPIPLVHGDITVLGFRFGNTAYLTDFNAVPESSFPLLQNLDVLILDALRDTPHPMHQTVEQALLLIDRLKPRNAWFTHIAHDLPHAETNERLRTLGYPHVQLGYDGLELEVDVEDDRPAPSAKPSSAKLTPFSVFSTPAAWNAHYGSLRRGSVLAIGNFDGIHLGHQKILRDVAHRAAATGDVATALTFEPAPLKVLRPELAPKRLSTPQQRLEWFRVVGLESAVVQAFTQELSQLSPEDFVSKILVDQLRVRAVLVGENFHFGHKQAGNTALLKQLGTKHHFEVIIVPPVIYHGEVDSSTVIRREIAEGDVTHAGRLLGRPFVLTGEVVSGAGVGHRFTVPTLNLAPEQELLPARGVYITRTLLDGETKSRRSVTNIGMRPTFNGTSLTVETHLLDAPPVFETKRIEIRFWKRLREERKFGSPEELKSQIAKDIAAAQRFFARLRKFRSARLSATPT